MISFDNMTLKVQEAFKGALDKAQDQGNPGVQVAHYLDYILDQPEGVIKSILQKIGVDLSQLQRDLQNELENLPRQSGGGIGQATLSQDLNAVFGSAEKFAQQLNDEYVSNEHVLLGIVKASHSKSAQTLKSSGVSEDTVLKVLKVLKIFYLYWKSSSLILLSLIFACLELMVYH